jgi:hypothetical protein
MWGVDPSKMCRQHLLGEHNEMHMVVGGIRKHPHGEAIAKGHGKKGQLDTSLIQQRHDALAREMRLRGIEHDSPLEYFDELDVGEVDVERHRDMLADRCPECRERIVSSA